MKKKIKIHLVGGARPNFVKIAPLLHLLEKDKIFDVKLINTGQHYDEELFGSIIKDLRIRKPDINLKVGSGSHNYQISEVIKKYDLYIKKNKPKYVFVFGDVNSTLAAAIAAKLNKVKVAHVEAGLRCYDENLPEEINRRLTDAISDIFFTPSLYENKNLQKENIKKNIFFVGNIMIDSLKFFFEKVNIEPKYKKIDGILTFHRPENVDNLKTLLKLVSQIVIWTKKYKILFPIHPRTIKNLKKFKLLNDLKKIENLKIIKPLGYLNFLVHMKLCKFIITDSGGIQEETTFLGIPCFTIRQNTERPITIRMGTNKLVDSESINNKLKKIKLNKRKKIPKWDGKTSERIIKIIKLLEKKSV